MKAATPEICALSSTEEYFLSMLETTIAIGTILIAADLDCIHRFPFPFPFLRLRQMCEYHSGVQCDAGRKLYFIAGSHSIRERPNEARVCEWCLSLGRC
jgi:hypothetical protein